MSRGSTSMSICPRPARRWDWRLQQPAVRPARHPKPANPLPPIRNPTVDGAAPRRNYMLPWVLAGLALLALIIALSQCERDDGDRSVKAADAPAIVTRALQERRSSRGRLRMISIASWRARTGCRAPSPSTRSISTAGPPTCVLRRSTISTISPVCLRLSGLTRGDRRLCRCARRQQFQPRSRRRPRQGGGRRIGLAWGSCGTGSTRARWRDPPAATNVTPGGRFENRRTELVILER